MGRLTALAPSILKPREAFPLASRIRRPDLACQARGCIPDVFSVDTLFATQFTFSGHIIIAQEATSTQKAAIARMFRHGTRPDRSRTLLVAK